MSNSRSPVELDAVEVKRTTPAAIQVEVDGRKVWIPRSQLLEENEVTEEGEIGLLVIPEWLAHERGLI